MDWIDESFYFDTETNQEPYTFRANIENMNILLYKSTNYYSNNCWCLSIKQLGIERNLVNKDLKLAQKESIDIIIRELIDKVNEYNFILSLFESDRR